MGLRRGVCEVSALLACARVLSGVSIVTDTAYHRSHEHRPLHYYSHYYYYYYTPLLLPLLLLLHSTTTTTTHSTTTTTTTPTSTRHSRVPQLLRSSICGVLRKGLSRITQPPTAALTVPSWNHGTVSSHFCFVLGCVNPACFFFGKRDWCCLLSLNTNVGCQPLNHEPKQLQH